MFGHIIKKHFKVSIREKALIFWSFLFPIILATLFHFAFSNLSDFSKINTIKVAIVEKKEDENFKQMLNSLVEQEILEVHYLELERAKLNLEENTISAYIITDNEIEMVVNKNGYNQTIVKHILDNYLQVAATFENLFMVNPEKASQLLIEGIEMNDNYVKSNDANVDMMVISFYSLIAMAALFGAFLGLQTINQTEANLSAKGIRNSMAPFSKMKIIIPGLILDFLIQATCVSVLISYMIILGVGLGNNLFFVYLIGIIGTFIGVLIGVLVGSISKLNENVKSSILIATTFTLAFFAGMVNVQVKYMVETNMSFIAKINPANLISDALYSLYYYETLDRYYQNVVSLIVIAIVLLIATSILMRRRQYDSI